MGKSFPDLEREDGLETVPEVPFPEEAPAAKHKPSLKSRRPPPEKTASVFGGQAEEIQFLLGVAGAPLVPLPIRSDRTLNYDIKGFPMESCMAKYIVQQYIAASGGEHALNSIDSMYAMGKVKMAASETVAGDEFRPSNARMKHAAIGGFVLWQKRPDLWSLELMVAGHKMSAGSDGRVAWRQTPWQHSHACRGPPRPLRRILQGLDPRSTANLFSNSTCIGEKSIEGEDCFALKLEADPSALRARSSAHVEIIRHAIWGYFSQRTGLLVQLEDSHLLRIKMTPMDDVFWETTMESHVRDYRTINGVNIAHSGRTSVSLFRFGENSENHSRTRMEETWSVEEVDFNVKGLSVDCFLPPADLKREDEKEVENGDDGVRNCKVWANPSRAGNGGGGARGTRKVVAIDDEEENLGGI